MALARGVPCTTAIMGRPIRWHTAGTQHFITNRVFQRRFLMRPDAEMNTLFLLWLAKALTRYPSIRCEGAATVSNHFHLIVTDLAGDLSEFMGYFQGNLAKAINRHRARDGAVFQRRFSAETIVDTESAVAKMLYLVANPAAAGLVDTYTHWPGVIEWNITDQAQEKPIRWFNQARYEAALDAAIGTNKKIDREDYWVEETLVIHPLTGIDEIGLKGEDLVTKVREHEQEIRRARGGRPPMGRAAVLAQAPNNKPRNAKRSKRPLCHASTRQLWEAYRDAYRRFLNAFWEASHALRINGDLTVPFPQSSYPPWRPIVRPPLA